MVALKLNPANSLSDRVLALLERVNYRRADTAGEREAIFRLRYEAYLREGAIAPSTNKRFCDAHDEAANTWIFGLYIEGELVSSIRLHVARSEERRVGKECRDRGSPRTH